MTFDPFIKLSEITLLCDNDDNYDNGDAMDFSMYSACLNYANVTANPIDGLY